ncbi:inactivation-no-after-potential D protein-like [Teleopsis dalmanni]|uniref:inactivation-no-after-potential D protein-like n=1 Tax=Teleopsis dalmanni TaxID=139649 RepID=UPI0018CF70CA|nr:inactivation-no-after-potential D protein-like [Teleopsis dalmanni]
MGHNVLHQFRIVTLNKTGYKSFGICIVRGEVKDSPNTKTSGIFIKGIVPDSPAHVCGQLKVGDRIMTLNNKDIRNATEQAVIELIKEAGITINMEIQTFDKDEEKTQDGFENGFIQSKQKHFTEQPSKQPMKQPQISKIESTEKRPPFTASIRIKNFTNIDDDEDTRDMTGRIRTEAGYEIDRASAGNCKLNKQEKERDKEQEDEFGYTMAKINKRYNLMKDVRRIEVQRTSCSPLGIALAGHKDRQRMSCFVAGVNPTGIMATVDIKPCDEILEVNGNVLQNRCHLNASVVFQNIDGEKLVLITSRRKTTDEGLSVKPIKKFPAVVDDTRFVFEQFPKARSVQVKKEGFLGIMIIYGKHADVGNGIFVSDLREESNAMLAGIKVGDLLLAVNKDVTLESSYDEAVALIKRAEGIVTLIVMSLKNDETLRAEKEVEEKQKTEAAKVEPEKPQEPATADVQMNKKTIIEVKIEKKPLGVIVVGGKNNYVKTGCVITHIYPEGAIAADKRLKVFDHILEVNSVQVNCAEMTTLKVHQLFHTKYDNTVTFQVYRADPPEFEKFNIDFLKKPGKEFGLSLTENERGCTISELTPTGYAEIDNKLQRGDIITKFNGENLDACSFPECYALIKASSGKISMEITRPKPACRTEASKT